MAVGSNVAKYSGEGLHKRIVADKAFAKGDYKGAIKNGFLEMDRALRYGMFSIFYAIRHELLRPGVTRTWCSKELSKLTAFRNYNNNNTRS